MVGTFYPGQNGGATWGYPGTFSGGIVGNAPPTSYNSVALQGGVQFAPSTLDEKIKFSSPVVNPFIAIWSLGQSGQPATFVFNNPFTIISGGPSTEYGGQSITQFGSAEGAFGIEGNGVIQFNGTFFGDRLLHTELRKLVRLYYSVS